MDVGRVRCRRRGRTHGPSADTQTGLRPTPATSSERLYSTHGAGVPHRELFGAPSSETFVEAALLCTDEADFRRRIREQLDPHAEIQR